MDFGDRLRRLRTSQGLAVRELARRVGVSGSYVSQLENNESKPSFSTLKRISQVTGTPVSILTEDGFPDEWVIVRKDGRRKVVVDEPGWEVELMAFTGARDKRMQPCIVRMQPGVEGPCPMFEHERDDIVFVLKGTLIIETDEPEYTVGPGDIAYLNFMRPRVFRNPGPGETEFLWVVSPAW